jgi:hypothetical protein
MFKEIVGVARPDGRSVALKHKKGEDIVLEQRVVQLVLQGRAVTVSDGFYFENETRLAEGQPPLNEIYDSEAIEKHDGPLVFTVTGSRPYPRITAEVTTEDHLYWFKDQNFGGEVNRKRVEIIPTDLHRATARVWNDALPDSGAINMVFAVTILLPGKEFERLFRNIWVAKTPCRLRLVTHMVCFQEPTEAAFNVFFPNDFLFEQDKPIPAKLESIHAEQSTLAPVNIPRIVADEQEDPALAASQRLQATMQSIEKALWWMLLFVVTIAAILILR